MKQLQKNIILIVIIVTVFVLSACQPKPPAVDPDTLPPVSQLQAVDWQQLNGWDGPALTLLGQSIAERGFNPQEFYDAFPGTAGQPHQLYPGMGFFLIEDVPEELATATIKFIKMN